MKKHYLSIQVFALHCSRALITLSLLLSGLAPTLKVSAETPIQGGTAILISTGNAHATQPLEQQSAVGKRIMSARANASSESRSSAAVAGGVLMQDTAERELATPPATPVSPEPSPQVTPMAHPKDTEPQPIASPVPPASEENVLVQKGTAVENSLQGQALASTNWVLNGDADNTTIPGAIKLTDDEQMVAGSAWAETQVDLNYDFDCSYMVYLGARTDQWGADGIVFAFQSVGTGALGNLGGQFGYGGIAPSFGVEMDTYYNYEYNDPTDLFGSGNGRHIGIVENGNVTHHGLPFDTRVSFEDNQEHWLRVVWQAEEKTFSVYWEGGKLLTYTRDVVDEIFGGNSLVWYGLTAATASGSNLQYFYETAPAIPEESTQSSGLEDGCLGCAYAQSQSHKGGPINTRTGAYDFSATDLSIPTTVGDLRFTRTYSSFGINEYSANLGYGWTHNHDLYLIIDTYQSGPEASFKAHEANQYKFWYDLYYFTPFPGVLATLTRDSWVYYLVDSSQHTYTIDYSSRKLLSYADAQGHTLNYTYDRNWRLLKVEDQGSGRFLSFSYKGQKTQIMSVEDQSGRKVSMVYDGAGNLVNVVDVMGQTWSYVYDAGHHLTEVIDPRGVTVERTEYDAQGRAVRQYDGEGNLVVELVYNADGTTTIWDGNGNTETDQYDSRRTLTSQTNAVGGSEQVAYDTNFRPTGVTDAAGATTQMMWSASGYNLNQVQDAIGNTTRMTYDSRNNLTSMVDARGITTTYAYSGSLLLSRTDGLGYTTTYTYTTAADAPQPPGLLKAVIDPLGNTTTYTYDQFGQRVAATDALMRTTTYAYDDLGRLLTVTDPLGRSNWTCYDLAGRVVRTVTNASGDGSSPQTDPCDTANYVASANPDQDRITTTVYDHAGNVIATIDPSGRITRTYYDNNNRPVTVVQNLVGQAIEVDTPPARNAANVDENIRSDTVYDVVGNVIAAIDPAGKITRTYYDIDNRPVTVVQNLVGQAIEVDTPPARDPANPDQNTRTDTVYDAAGNPIATIDPLGTITRTYYDELSRPVTVVQNLVGQAIEVSTPPVRNPAVPDENLRSDTVYDQVGNAIAAIDPAGRITRTYYDPNLHPVTVVQNLTGQGVEVTTPPARDPANPDQNVRTDTVYDDAGNAIASVDPLGVVTRTYYDANRRPVTVVQNLVGQTIEVSTPPGRNPAVPDENLRTDMVYDELGNPIATIDPLGLITRTYYDGLSRSVTVVQNLVGQAIEAGTPPARDPANPDQNVRTDSVYDASGQAIAMVDPLGKITRDYFDNLSRPVSTVQNLVGQAIEVDTPPARDPAHPDQNARTDKAYDVAGDTIAAIDPLGKITRTYYDGLDRSVTVVQNLTGQGIEVTTPPARDPANPDQNVRTDARYDAAGNALAAIDPLGAVTRTYYDGVYLPMTVVQNLTGQAIEVATPPARDPANPDQNVRTDTVYDVLGNRLSLADPNNLVTRFEYDGMSRLAAVVENYRPGFNPDHETNVRTEYAYDAKGKRLSILDGKGHTTVLGYDGLGRLLSESDPLAHTTTYTYDAGSRRTAILDANGATTTFFYDALGRLVAIDYPAPDADVSFTYDAAGHRLSMSDGLGSASWTYDDLGRIASVTDPLNATVGYSYDLLGNRTGLAYPDGKSVSYTFDGVDRLKQVSAWDTSVTGYSYDAAGRQVSVSLPNGVTSSYDYDGLGRLLALTHVAGTENLSSFAYTYDPAGNRTQLVETLGLETTISYTYDPLYRLTEADYSDGTYFRYTYDAVGNRLSEETVAITNTYAYDAANRLMSVDGVPYTWDNNGNLLSDGVYTYSYDHANQLISVSGAGTTVSYGYNGQGDRLSQTVGITTTTYTLDLAAGLTQVLSDGTDSYLYGKGRIAQYDTSGAQYFLGDALGSVRQLVDAGGGVLLAQSYVPYGDVLDSAGEGVSSYGFTAEMRDSYIKLIYLRSRDYSPATGRFLTQDSWRGDYTRPLSLNGWNYVEGNPINFVDPSGFIKETESNTADQILEKLKNDYEVLILKDYGVINGGYGSCEKGWDPGAWRTLEELQWVEEGIDKAVLTMGGSSRFKSAMRGQVVIWRLGIPEIKLPIIGSQPRGFAPPGGLIDVALPDEVFNYGKEYARYTTVHELGHVWDRRTSLRLSNELMLYMGTLVCQGMGGCYFNIWAGNEEPPGYIDRNKNYAATNAMEDWAEAFASTVYPSYYDRAGYRRIGPLREQFVLDRIKQLP